MAELVSAFIGLAAIGFSVSQSLCGIINELKDAPRELRSLSDELFSFHDMLSLLLETDFFREQRIESPLKAHSPAVGRGKVVADAREILYEIWDFIQEMQKQNGKDRGELKVNKMKWVLQHKRTQRMRERLANQKQGICQFLIVHIL